MCTIYLTWNGRKSYFLSLYLLSVSCMLCVKHNITIFFLPLFNNVVTRYLLTAMFLFVYHVQWVYLFPLLTHTLCYTLYNLELTLNLFVFLIYLVFVRVPGFGILSLLWLPPSPPCLAQLFSDGLSAEEPQPREAPQEEAGAEQQGGQPGRAPSAGH